MTPPSLFEKVEKISEYEKKVGKNIEKTDLKTEKKVGKCEESTVSEKFR